MKVIPAGTNEVMFLTNINIQLNNVTSIYVSNMFSVLTNLAARENVFFYVTITCYTMYFDTALGKSQFTLTSNFTLPLNPLLKYEVLT